MRRVLKTKENRIQIIDKIIAFLIKSFILVSLVFPMITVIKSRSDSSRAYPEFILSNLIVCFILAFVIIKVVFYKQWVSDYKYLLIALIILILLYDFFYLKQFDYIRWIWNAVNVTISFMFLGSLVVSIKKKFFNECRIIEFLIKAILITNFVGIIIYSLGYMSVGFADWKISFIPFNFQLFYEYRFNWIYFHKSQYSLMLLLYLGVFIVYKQKFINKGTYIASVIFLFICLFLAHTNTSIIGAVIILLCDFIDYVLKNTKKNKRILYLGGISFSAVIGLFLLRMSRERDLFSLGSRTVIWKASIKRIIQLPHGVGLKFRAVFIPLSDYMKTDNCHNVFLNEAFRFSIPVGISYTALFVLLVFYSLKQKFSFLRLGIWLAVLIQLNMDYSLIATDLSIFLFLIYCIFFLPVSKNKETCTQ